MYLFIFILLYQLYPIICAILNIIKKQIIDLERNKMTEENAKILQRINAYAEEVLADIDPQKTPVSTQLETLKPIMQQIADEKGMDIMDMFILYMDLATEAGVIAERKFQDDINDGSPQSFSSIANVLK